ncbi:MAG: FecR family protein [Butyricimonas faecalis]|jgi:putative anti-sigma factor|uniref:FecR family protein n=1 Tax=Butyricimonas faecalis TaxID=2093856 RepID=UPI0013157C7E|nr:FecR family protein [Butyricimonas faecalis]MBS7155768.1 FecR domain-containing protein [Sanguibacteroides justesenii]
MDYNQEKIIAEIILKIRFGTATEDEKQQVENWVAEKEEHRLLYEKIVSGKSIAEYLKKEGDVKAVTDIKAVSARVRERIQEKEMGKRRVLRKWYAVTGAACLIGIILGGVFLNHEDRESVALVENNPEQVVNEKVMLVLSDGQTIGLAHQGTDSIYIGQATIIKKENQLAYQRRQDTLGTRVEEERNRIITTVGGDYCFILSDGTKVWLNAESELDFPVDFVGKERVVRLKGEAYFEVKPDAAHPFIVETRGVRTRVLGTSFNIKAYDNEESIFTTLLTGKVKVSAIGEENESVVLTPGMQSEWQENGQKMSVKKVNAENFTAWRQGAFMFDNENIMVVTRVLERWYGLKFIYNENVHEHTFSGRLSKDEPLESILETLTFTGGPQFKIEKDVVYIIEKK